MPAYKRGQGPLRSAGPYCPHLWIDERLLRPVAGVKFDNVACRGQRHVVNGLGVATAGVRGEHDVGQSAEWMIAGERLLGKHVKTGASQMAGAERVDQVLFNDETTAAL